MRYILFLSMFFLSSCGGNTYEMQEKKLVDPDFVRYAGECDTDYTSLNQKMYDLYPFEYENRSGIKQIEITHLNNIFLLPTSFLDIAFKRGVKITMAEKLRDIEELNYDGFTAAGMAGGGENIYLSDGTGGSEVAIHEMIHILFMFPGGFKDPRVRVLYDQVKAKDEIEGKKSGLASYGYGEFLPIVAERFYCSKSDRDWIREDYPALYQYMNEELEPEFVRQYELFESAGLDGLIVD